jgi:hypothetical protein
MGPQHNRLIELLRKDDALTDVELREMRRLNNQEAKSHVQGMALIRMSLDGIEAIRGFDRASADLIKTTNRLTRWMLWFTILAVLIAVAALIPAWLPLLGPAPQPPAVTSYANPVKYGK